MRERGQDRPVPPAVKNWLDNVIVPALVREYLVEMKREKAACSEIEPVAECAAESTATVEGVR